MAELCQTQQLAGDSDYSKCCWYFFFDFEIQGPKRKEQWCKMYLEKV